MRQDAVVPRPIPTPILHMTRVERLPSIIELGLLPDNDVQQRSVGGVTIGYSHIKDRRAKRAVPCGVGGSLADYVPFYFAPRSPMLYAITRGLVSAEAADTDQIVYLQTSTQTLRHHDLTVVTSNRHAELDFAELDDDDACLDDDNFVDWPLMQAQYWNNDADHPDRKERRQAECLVHPAVPWFLIEEVSTKTAQAAHAVQQHARASDHRPSIAVRPNWYF